MRLEKHQIDELNHQQLANHKRRFEFIAEGISNVHDVVQKLSAFNIAIPSWALGTGGTRFGRFSGGGEPRSLEEKIEDVGIIHALNKIEQFYFASYSLGYSFKCTCRKNIGCSIRITFRCGELQYFSGSAGSET